mgnify:CR=1 FL=1
MAVITAASVLHSGFGLVNTTMAAALDGFFILLWIGAQIVKTQHQEQIRATWRNNG